MPKHNFEFTLFKKTLKGNNQIKVEIIELMG